MQEKKCKNNNIIIKYKGHKSVKTSLVKKITPGSRSCQGNCLKDQVLRGRSQEIEEVTTIQVKRMMQSRPPASQLLDSTPILGINHQDG